MKVRKFGITGQSNETEDIALINTLSSMYPNASLKHMAILGCPSITVVNPHAIAGIFTFQGRLASFVYGDVRLTVACTYYNARSGCKYNNIGPHSREITQPEVCSGMSVV